MNALKWVLVGGLSAVLVSCGGGSYSGSSGGFDPLGRPGGAVGGTQFSEFSPGAFVKVVIPDSVFFKSFPEGEAEADRLLALDTTVKVVGEKQSFVKVELEDGSIGFIPAMMLAVPEVPAVPDKVEPSTEPEDDLLNPDLPSRGAVNPAQG